MEAFDRFLGSFRVRETDENILDGGSVSVRVTGVTRMANGTSEIGEDPTVVQDVVVFVLSVGKDSQKDGGRSNEDGLAGILDKPVCCVLTTNEDCDIMTCELPIVRRVRERWRVGWPSWRFLKVNGSGSGDYGTGPTAGELNNVLD